MLAFEVDEGISGAMLHGIKKIRNLLAEEGGDDGRGSLIGTQTVSIRCAHDGGLQQTVVLINADEGLDDEREEAKVVFGRLAGSVENSAAIRRQRPVAMLAATIDSGKGLLVEEAAEAVLASHLAHQAHDEHIVVNSQIALLEDGSQLKLVGGNLIVAGLAGNAEFECLNFEVAHELCDALRDGAEIVVVHLLILRRLVAHERTPREQEVRASGIQALIYEEILLLPTQIGTDACHRGIEIMANGSGSAIDGGEGFLQRSLIVEGFARVGDEDGGNHQRVANDEDGAGRVPSGIAASLEGGTNASRWETGGIGLLLYKEFAAELLHHAALPVVFEEGIVLLGSSLRQGLEPVGHVGGPHLHGPLLHALSDFVGRLHIERHAVSQCLTVLLISAGGEILEHLRAVEDVLSVELAGTLGGRLHVDRMLLESFLDDVES